MQQAFARRLLHGALLVLFAALAACDAITMKELKPGVSTGYEVRDRMGAPSMEWKNLDGTLTWEYTRQPMGTENFMIVIGPDNIMREIRQVVTEENFGRVEKGMTREQVRRLLGKPGKTMFLDLKKEEVWDWRYKGTHGNDMFFHVHFDPAGNVVATSRTEDHRG